MRAYTDVGLRVVMAPAMADLVFYQTVPGLLGTSPPDLRRTVEGLQSSPTEGLLQIAEDTVRRWHGAASVRARVAVSPTIPGQCSDTFFAGCVRLAREYDVGLHTHLAESKVQAIASQQRWGTTLVGRLAAIGALGPNFVGAHGVWITDDDIRRLAMLARQWRITPPVTSSSDVVLRPCARADRSSKAPFPHAPPPLRPSPLLGDRGPRAPEALLGARRRAVPGRYLV